MDALRPSSAHCWTRCQGAPALIESLNLPPTESWYAAEGTAAHELAAWCLEQGREPDERLGETIEVTRRDGEEPFQFEVTEEMTRAVSHYIEAVRREAHGESLTVEQELDVTPIIPVENRRGTADAVIMPGDEDRPLQIWDLKYGKGVAVSPEENDQLTIYAAAFVYEFAEMFGPWNRVRMVIHQPRLGAPAEWEVDADTLMTRAQDIHEKACEALGTEVGDNLNPGEEQCRFCPAKAHCPALTEAVNQAVDQDWDVVDGISLPATELKALAERRKLVPLVEQWANAVRNRVQELLEAGQPVPDFKLVQGRRGHRKWSDNTAAEQQLKHWRLRKDQMYDMKLISPAQAEKVVSEQRFEKLIQQGLVTQNEGKPTVAPADDPRPAYEPNAMFDNVE